jgi:hypothetical protein
MRLAYVNDDVPAVTTELLRAACGRRGVAFLEIDAPAFPYDPDARLLPGDMLYRAGISLAAQRAEQFLAAEDVATFHADPAGAWFGSGGAAVLFQRAGVPAPRSLPLAPGGRHLLEQQVEAVGGFPVVVKVPGGSGGVGTMQVDSWPGLNSLLDHLFARGEAPLLCAFVDNAVHWRLTVVGDRAVACYRNLPQERDFRTCASEDPLDFTATPPPPLADLAVRAVRALRLEFGGVDVLEHPSGRLYVLEANFPCFFAQPQTVAGIDVAGAMLGHLMRKARAILDRRAEGAGGGGPGPAPPPPVVEA